MMNFIKQTYVKHFIWTQIQTLILFLIVTTCIARACDAGWYIFHWIPFLLIFMMIEFILVWQPESDMTSCLNSCNCLLLIVCAPVFLLVFFYGFYPTTSIQFEQVDKCVVSGIQKTSLDGNEAYSLIYVNYVQNGNTYLGQGCLTNQYQGGYTNVIAPFSFYNKNETFSCGPGVVDSIKGNALQNTTQSNSTQTHSRILRAGGGGGGGHGGGGGGHSSGTGGHSGGSHSITQSRPSYQTHSYDPIYGYRYHPYPYYGSSTDSCQQTYSFSEVKIPTWLCGADVYNLKELMTPKKCYVSYHNKDSGKAEENAYRRLDQRNQSEFALISFEYPSYYPKKLLTFYIILFYYPLIMTSTSIFQYTANYIVKSLYGEDNEAETNKYNYGTGGYNNNDNLEMDLMKQSM